jgi:hypothetical protein
MTDQTPYQNVTFPSNGAPPTATWPCRTAATGRA